MSVWSENPEWFDKWLTVRAAEGRFGPELQDLAEVGDFIAQEWWDKLDTDGKLGEEAMTDYVERFIP